jgi:hypothetical protein
VSAREMDAAPGAQVVLTMMLTADRGLARERLADSRVGWNRYVAALA